MNNNYDTLIIGGGMIGAAVAYGLAKLGVKTLMLDEHTPSFRAATGNFGLVWVQGKGIHTPEYACLTQESSQMWPAFNAELEALTGIQTGYKQTGGMHLFLDEHAMQQRTKDMAALSRHCSQTFHYDMLDKTQLKRVLPYVGDTVAGASFSPHDAHVNPLYLLRALHSGFAKHNGSYLPNRAEKITQRNDTIEVVTNAGKVYGKKLLIAAGLHTPKLAQQVGLYCPLQPQRGQILVTERLPQFLPLPTAHVRQTEEGTVLIGDSKEDVGYNTQVEPQVLTAIAKRACTMFPILQQTSVIRSWGALRILTNDGLPLYEQRNQVSTGVFVASSHSGVTLAAAHALLLASSIANGQLPQQLSLFSSQRFHVQNNCA